MNQSGEQHREWPPPPLRGKQDAAKWFSAPKAPEVKPRAWLASLAWFLFIAGALLAVWLGDWRWLVTGLLTMLAVNSLSYVDLAHRKRKAGQ